MKLSKEAGSVKAASELGISVDTLYGWGKAAREGRLDSGFGFGSHMPEPAMSLEQACFPVNGMGCGAGV